MFKIEPLEAGDVVWEDRINYFEIMGQAQKLYSRYLEPVCQTWKLHRCELDVLLFLYNNPYYDRATDIALRRGIAKSHVSLSVANLERRGFLCRRYDQGDRRNAHLALTPAGTEPVQAGREAQERFFSVLHQGISQEEFAVWQGITRRILENMDAMDTR